MTVRHNAFSISSISFDFWIEFPNILIKCTQNNIDKEFIGNAYLELFKIVCEKCRLKRLKNFASQ